ncbi:hypothetical protein [Novosphingobium pentaromativorans]|uniref:SnoaL-like domain-containing protein n=1 Tax=Novosphingobium pentaromativorans US6-1 TaxID=1088721 RepID=G6EAS2_9SPHN|nr:hypothetical protein [Novosphingobium pentaromativorans]AIT80584.1 hypothetical protein JI59_12805 [Novosphingobium pentaromativorans US6-1]EHJ61709.1 hypothetical protein NSU_1470 [Novosphingobium pentaromativorans US6-1]
MFDFDVTRTYRPIEEKLNRTTNSRHRRMLQMLLQHARAEVEGDLGSVLATLAPWPVYKGVRPKGPQPEGPEEVRRFYIDEIFGSGRHVFESNKTRIIVDDDAIITEGPMRILLWGRDLADRGMQLDDADAVYLMTVDVLIVWPFDEECRIVGEESWSQPMVTPMQKIAEEDVPQAFRDYVVRRKAAAAN